MEENATKARFGDLSLFSLISLVVGTIVGVGVMSLMGSAIQRTGYSVWLAFPTAMLWITMIYLPLILTTKCMRINGGEYGIVSGFNHSKAIVGIYTFASMLSFLQIANYGTTVAVYLKPLFPGMNNTLVAFLFTTFFYVVNLFGTNIMSKVQNIMAILLYTGLGVFVLIGATKITEPVFSFSNPNFFSGGFDGFFAAVMLCTSACASLKINASYSMQAKKGPLMAKAMIIGAVIVALIYGAMAVISVGVMPLSETAGQPLTIQAKAILPTALFYYFIIGGVIMAISTSLNSLFTGFSVPVARACENGWLPKVLAKRNRFGAPYFIMTILYIVGLVPILLGWNISTIMTNSQLMSTVVMYVLLISLIQLPKQYPESFEKLKMGKGLYYGLCVLGIIFQAVITINSIFRLSQKIVVFSLVCMAIATIVGIWRSKSENVKVIGIMYDEDGTELVPVSKRGRN